MFNFDRIAEAKIAEAMANGEFDDLTGAGQPLVLDDDSDVPPELRMAHRIFKNSGHLPPALQIRKEIAEIEQSLIHTKDETVRAQAIRRLNLLMAKLDQAQSGLSLAAQEKMHVMLKIKNTC